jgi:hypothetical protein
VGGAVIAVTLGPVAARAEPPDREACLGAYVASQQARKSGALLLARRHLEICLDAACPGLVQRDCNTWLAEVERALPSVVVAARDSVGKDLLEATATIDGSQVALDGHVCQLDPGKHTVRVRASTGDTREETFVLGEGEHGRAIVLTFPAASAPNADSTGATSSRHVPVATWVLGGIGVASLGAFGVFAAHGAVDRGNLGCDHGCSDDAYSTVNRQFIVADITLVAGIALVGAAVVWWLVDSRGVTSADRARPTARIAW